MNTDATAVEDRMAVPSEGSDRKKVTPRLARCARPLVFLAAISGLTSSLRAAPAVTCENFNELGNVYQQGVNTNGLNGMPRSEEHTSELQSRRDLVCRLLLEKKKKKK